MLTMGLYNGIAEALPFPSYKPRSRFVFSTTTESMSQEIVVLETG